MCTKQQMAKNAEPSARFGLIYIYSSPAIDSLVIEWQVLKYALRKHAAVST